MAPQCSHCSGPAGQVRAEPASESADVLVAYLHLTRQTSTQAKTVLEEQIKAFADREGFDLRRLIVGIEGGSDMLTLRALVEYIHATSATQVLVVGPARHALVALRRITGVQILTLAQVRPAGRTPDEGSLG